MRTILLILLSLIAFTGFTQQDDPVYMFSYFKGKGQDGLHLAYSMDGYKYIALNNDSFFLTPEISKDKLMRDPCIIVGPDGLFHIVWTVSWHDKGIGYANSKDLIHWSEQSFIPVMEHEPTAINCWAPEIIYDEENQEYLIYWATTIPGRFPETDSSGDNGLNHRIYSATTKDFKTFSETRLFYDPCINVIDATIQKDGKQFVMFIKNETKYPTVAKDISVVTSSSLREGYGKMSMPITTSWTEGPTAIKIDGQWIVYFDKYRQHQMGAVSSKDLKTWTDISDKIEFSEGTRHGSVFITTTEVLNKLKGDK